MCVFAWIHCVPISAERRARVSERTTKSAIFSQFFIRHTITWLRYVIRLVHAFALPLFWVDAKMSRRHKHAKAVLANVEYTQKWATKKRKGQKMRNICKKQRGNTRSSLSHTLIYTLKRTNDTWTAPLTNCIPFYRHACIKSQTAIAIVVAVCCHCRAAIFQTASTDVVVAVVVLTPHPVR